MAQYQLPSWSEIRNVFLMEWQMAREATKEDWRKLFTDFSIMGRFVSNTFLSLVRLFQKPMVGTSQNNSTDEANSTTEKKTETAQKNTSETETKFSLDTIFSKHNSDLIFKKITHAMETFKEQLNRTKAHSKDKKNKPK